MATLVGVLDLFELLRRLGRRRPDGWTTGRGPAADEAELANVAQAWAAVLADIPDADLLVAGALVVRTKPSGFWPDVGDIAAAARGADAVAPIEAWGLIKPRLNSYSAPEIALGDLPDNVRPLLLSAIEAVGGWHRLCQSLVSEEGHIAHAVAGAFEAARKRAAYAPAGRLLDLRRGVLRLVDGGGR